MARYTTETMGELDVETLRPTQAGLYARPIVELIHQAWTARLGDVYDQAIIDDLTDPNNTQLVESMEARIAGNSGRAAAVTVVTPSGMPHELLGVSVIERYVPLPKLVGKPGEQWVRRKLHKPAYPNVRDLEVTPPYKQGSVIGALALKHGLNQLGFPDAPKVKLWSELGNDEGIAFFESLGFHRSGSLQSHILERPGQKTLEMPFPGYLATGGVRRVLFALQDYLRQTDQRTDV